MEQESTRTKESLPAGRLVGQVGNISRAIWYWLSDAENAPGDLNKRLCTMSEAGELRKLSKMLAEVCEKL